jgi:hypothetical protein
MSLLVDNRTRVRGAGVHALIIGVSSYPDLPAAPAGLLPRHYGMTQLSSPALAAFRIYQWLADSATRLPVPLVTCRVLLLPSADEIAAEPLLRSFGYSWQTETLLQELADWRNDASVSSGGMTVFYFAGHGVQRSIGDSVMLLPGFGNGIGGALRNAIDTANICGGMAPTPTRPNIARTQLYFVDACRILPDEFRKFERLQTTPAFDVELNARDDRRAPIFYAAIPGTVANGIRGKQSLFSAALLEALRGSGAEAGEEDAHGNVPWRVTVHSLDAALAESMEALNASLGGAQEYTSGGSQRNADICFLSGPPRVEVIMQLEPSPAESFGALEVRDYLNQPVWVTGPPITPHPCTKLLPAGNYTVNVAFRPPQPSYRDYTRLRFIKPLPRRQTLTARCS